MTLCGNRVFTEVIKFSEDIRRALIPGDWSPYKKGKFGHRRARGECPGTMKAGLRPGLSKPGSTADRQQSARGPGRGRKGSLSQPQEESALRRLDLRRLASRAVRQHSPVASAPSVPRCYAAPPNEQGSSCPTQGRVDMLLFND